MLGGDISSTADAVGGFYHSPVDTEIVCPGLRISRYPDTSGNKGSWIEARC